MDLHVHLHHDEDLVRSLERIESLLHQILKQGEHMAGTLHDDFLALEAQVQATTDIEDAAAQAFVALAAQFKDAAGDKDAVVRLAAKLKERSDALAAAVAATTTEAAPPAPPAPIPPAPAPPTPPAAPAA